MSSDGADPSASESMIKTAEQLLRKAIAQYGLQHQFVLERLNLYLDLMDRAGRSEQVKELAEQARLLRKKLNVAEPEEKTQPATSAPTAASPPAKSVGASAKPAAAELPKSGQPADESEKHFFNSIGEHIATQVQHVLYSPSGRFMAYWSPEMEVFIDRKGWYFGRIAEDNRLEREKSWRFKHINFGNKAGEADRAGWDKQRDIDFYQPSPGCEDVNVDEFEFILGER